MFKITVNNLVQTIGDDVYLPSPGLIASGKLSPLSLVERKGSILQFTRDNDYYVTDFTVENVLVDQNVKFDIEPDQPLCTFNGESTMKVDGSLQGPLREIFDARVQKGDLISIKTNFGELVVSEINLDSLLWNLHRRKLNMDHSLVRELSNKERRALCLVTSVVKTTTETDVIIELTPNSAVDETEEGQTSLMIGVKDRTSNSTDIQNSKKSLHLPAGTVVAYEIRELAVTDSGAVRVMVARWAHGGFHSKDLEGSQFAKVVLAHLKRS